jgi:hypothetical protein
MTNELEVKQAVVDPVLDQMQQFLTVRTVVEYDASISFLKQIKASHQKVEREFGPMIEAANKAHKDAIALRNRILAPLVDAEAKLRDAAVSWKKSEDKRIADEQARLQREADERAKREREALERKAAEMKTEAKRDEYLSKAAAVVAPVVRVETEAPQVSGAAIATTWTFDVVDVNQIPREYMSVDMVKIGKVVRAMKAGTNIPGVRVFTKEGLRVRI